MVQGYETGQRVMASKPQINAEARRRLGEMRDEFGVPPSPENWCVLKSEVRDILDTFLREAETFDLSATQQESDATNLLIQEAEWQLEKFDKLSYSLSSELIACVKSFDRPWRCRSLQIIFGTP